MNIKKIVIAALLFFSVAALFPTNAVAASQDECAIWLCLPGGFGSGCGGALSAMKDRVKHGHSPLPPFSECAIDSGDDQGYTDPNPSTMTSSYSVAAFIPRHTECEYDLNTGFCTEIEVPSHRVRGTACRVEPQSGIKTPRYCTRTEWEATVFIDGRKQGDTYRW